MENTCEYLHDYLYCHARCVKMRLAETLAPPSPSVCLFVRHSLTDWYCVKTAKCIVKILSRLISLSL